MVFGLPEILCCWTPPYVSQIVVLNCKVKQLMCKIRPGEQGLLEMIARCPKQGQSGISGRPHSKGHAGCKAPPFECGSIESNDQGSSTTGCPYQRKYKNHNALCTDMRV